MPLTRTEQLAWVAGIIDGEGSIFLTRSTAKSSGKYYYPQVKICNCNLKMIREVVRILGLPRKINKIKKVKDYHKQVYYIYYAANDTINVLKLVQPYLIAKQRQARICINLWKVNKLILEKYGMLTKTGRKIFTNYYEMPKELARFLHECFV